ncbi:hypothetical protein B481_3363 [Planococcus halocryophilus Or1]|nr:hypothetical protein B481_3363 [Planococcus halocryophilus Or1]
MSLIPTLFVFYALKIEDISFSSKKDDSALDLIECAIV